MSRPCLEEAVADIFTLVNRIGPSENGAFLDRKGRIVQW